MTAQELITVTPDGSVPSRRPAARAPRRRRWLGPAAFLLAVCAVLGGVLVNGDEEPGVPLGAPASVPGGLVRINGVLPCGQAGGQAEDCSPELGGAAPQGSHRVKVLLELTAMDSEGLDFDADDYEVDRLGGGTSPALWASPAESSLRQGGTLQAAVVFEVPDQAVELVVDGAGDARLALGTGHHRPGGS